MPMPSSAFGQQGPTCFDKMKTGFTIGFCVGMASGALFGGFSALRWVAEKYLNTLQGTVIRLPVTPGIT